MLSKKSTPHQITTIHHSLRQLGMGSDENKLLPTIEDGKVSKITLTAESPDARRSLFEGRTKLHLQQTVQEIMKIEKQGIATLVLHYTDEKLKPRAKKQNGIPRGTRTARHADASESKPVVRSLLRNSM